MKHLDITFDFETCSTAPDAAPMQLGAIAWDRHATDSPFLEDDTFTIGIDLRTCVMAGFSFDQSTIDFWSRQNDMAKQNVIQEDMWPVDLAFSKFADWIEATLGNHGADTVCLWCQGQDFDFPILKTIARKFGLQMPVHQHYFRDCRTFVLESVLTLLSQSGRTNEDRSVQLTFDDVIKHPMRAYDMIPKLSSKMMEGRTQHDALYDCMRSTWSVWQCMKMLQR